MIQAIAVIDPDQSIPVISYIRRRLCAPREDTSQYYSCVLFPAKKSQTGGHPDRIRRQQTSRTQEPLENGFRWFRPETLPSLVRANTL